MRLRRKSSRTSGQSAVAPASEETAPETASETPTDETNPLRAYFYANGDRPLIHKWVHYFDIYDRHFSPYRGREVTVVEFGISHGGSLRMWRDYFGPAARIIGVDIDERCRPLATPDIEVVIGDQANVKFLHELAEITGPIDVLIEDGGHRMRQMLNTFREMWPHVRDGGVYLAEDLHACYWSGYGGGYRKQGTFIEYAKGLIDSINAWHSKDKNSFCVDDYTRSVRGMHVYDSIIVFDKGTVEPPHAEKVGRKTLN